MDADPWRAPREIAADLDCAPTEIRDLDSCEWPSFEHWCGVREGLRDRVSPAPGDFTLNNGNSKASERMTAV